MSDSAVIRVAPKVTAEDILAKIVNNQSLVLIYPDSGRSYQWYVDNQAIPNANLQYYIVIPGGITGTEYLVYVEPSIPDQVTGLKCGDRSPVWSNSHGKLLLFDKSEIFVLYPNPAHDKLTLVFNEALLTSNSNINGKMRITDLTGKRIAEFTLNGISNEIALRGLNKGAYMVRVEINGEFLESRKLIIM
jgi:hypothetical protein